MKLPRLTQVQRFYWASFLKNQTYFTPILIVFLQAQSLSFQQIFWVFTIGSIMSFLIEIPTGIIADVYGKRKSIIISKAVITIAFIWFGFSQSFWMFVVAQVLYEIGQSFRSGTETAYTYDYLTQAKEKNPFIPTYTKVKGKQKFYARIGESIATALGGVIAGVFGFSWAFFFAAIPAFINFIMNISWQPIRESQEHITLHKSLSVIKKSLKEIKQRKLIRITLNITLFTAVLAAANKFIQPYMTTVGVPIELFGILYAVALGITALAVKYSYLFEDKFGSRNTINWMSALAIIPALIIGIGFSSWVGVFLFFLIIIVENIRSPIANSLFHNYTTSEQRATMGSLLSLSKNAGKSILLPLIGWAADFWSLSFAMLILGGLLLINASLFFVEKEKKKTSYEI